MCVKWVRVIGWDSRTRLRVATDRFVIVHLQKICFYYLLQFSFSYTAILHMKYGKEFWNMEFSRKRYLGVDIAVLRNKLLERLQQA